METAAFSYRIADFLKKHPPFHSVDEEDLLQLAQGGTVRFFESNEYILSQGEPYRFHILVIQQGTVTVWDESGEPAELGTCAAEATSSESNSSMAVTPTAIRQRRQRMSCTRFPFGCD
jgi:signal-transduction protein with cAMP-binding, CBS, and nucleotidyltransferase domain